MTIRTATACCLGSVDRRIRKQPVYILGKCDLVWNQERIGRRNSSEIISKARTPSCRQESNDYCGRGTLTAQICLVIERA